MSQVNIQRSIRWQLDNLTPAMVSTFCDIAELEPMTEDEFRDWWSDWTWDGLDYLLVARGESEEPMIEIDLREGSSLSGNYGHAGIPGSRGGSMPGGGHSALGVGRGASDEEKKEAVAQRRKERDEEEAPQGAPSYGDYPKDQAQFAEWQKRTATMAEDIREKVLPYGVQAEALEQELTSAYEGLAQAWIQAHDQIESLDKSASGYDEAKAQILRQAEEVQQKTEQLVQRLNRAQEGGLAGTYIMGAGIESPATVTVGISHPEGRHHEASVRSTISMFEARALEQVPNVHIAPLPEGRARECCSGDIIEVRRDSPAFVIAHETGHAIEHQSARVATLAQMFLEKRTAGETAKPLGGGYAADEVAKPDKFPSPYCGKIYDRGSTEIVSMGLTYMSSNPAKFAKDDPEYFRFMVGVMRGL